MKHLFFILILLILVSESNFAKDIIVNFSAGNELKIDSVWVTNLSSNKKVKLLTGESLLLSDNATGINEPVFFDDVYMTSDFKKGRLNIYFSCFEMQNVSVKIINLSGVLLNGKSGNVSPGKYVYSVDMPGSGVFIIRLGIGDSQYSFKALSESATVVSGFSLNLISSIENTPELRLATQLKTLGFASGDVLFFSAFSGIMKTIITDSPTDNKSYPVDFFSCVDYENNSYSVVKIGNQYWMAENLKSTKYADGSAIPVVENNDSWKNLKTFAICYFNNIPGNKDSLGVLYNWYAINDTKKITPDGWHVPTDEEWTNLENYLISNGYNYDGSLTDNKISKSLAATYGWKISNSAGTPSKTDFPAFRNKTGFTALPVGHRANDGAFYNLSLGTYFWSNTEAASNVAWFRYIGYSSKNVTRGYISKTGGLSVRCVKN